MFNGRFKLIRDIQYNSRNHLLIGIDRKHRISIGIPVCYAVTRFIDICCKAGRFGGFQIPPWLGSIAHGAGYIEIGVIEHEMRQAVISLNYSRTQNGSIVIRLGNVMSFTKRERAIYFKILIINCPVGKAVNIENNKF